MLGGQKIEPRQPKLLSILHGRNSEKRTTVKGTKNSSAHEKRQMVLLHHTAHGLKVSLPNRENQVHHRHPMPRNLVRILQVVNLSVLRLKFLPVEDWKQWMDRVKVSVQQLIGDFLGWKSISVDAAMVTDKADIDII